MKRNLALLVLAVVAALSAACGSGKGNPEATSTPRPLPTPVVIRQEPQNVALRDPTFEALPGAKADFGHLGGTVYRIEIPDNWNGRLLLYMHGFQGLAPTAEVEDLSIRSYLIRNGWAWGASSYSSTSLIPSRAADETAALWDYFVHKYGRPTRTYITGHSMGGAATNIAAERYGDRYDGALQLCGFAGQSAETAVVGDYFVAGAFVAGLKQADFDSGDVSQLLDGRIRPALKDPTLNKRFEDIMLDLTGGPRAFDHEGFVREEGTNWERTSILVSSRLAYNEGRQYKLGPLSATSSAEFNASVIRVPPSQDKNLLATFLDGNELTGKLQMPMLTMHTTGDWQVPIDQEQILRRKVDGAGKGDLLVQRAVKDAGHCGFTNAEWEKGLEDLVAWVEHGKKPKGENLLVSDLTNAGKFNLAPRFGSSEAGKVKGAGARITMSGTITLDGKPVDGNLFPVVRTGDLDQPACSFSYTRVTNGHYEMTVAGKGELAGCGATGAEVYLSVYISGSNQQFTTQQTIAWPTNGKQLTFDATLSTSAKTPMDRPGSSFGGAVLDSSGKLLPPGTVVAAYAGDTLCGVSSLPRAVMAFSDPSSYVMWVVGPAACAKGTNLSFKIDGKPAVQTAVNDQADHHVLDLSLP